MDGRWLIRLDPHVYSKYDNYDADGDGDGEGDGETFVFTSSQRRRYPGAENVNISTLCLKNNAFAIKHCVSAPFPTKNMLFSYTLVGGNIVLGKSGWVFLGRRWKTFGRR